MEAKNYTQFGTFSVAIMLPLLILFTGLLIKSGLSSSPEMYIYLFLVLTFAICLLIFYKLTIIIDKTNVSFKLGIGLVGKSYKITDIKSCKSVANSALNGIGIRMLSNGWLYNVSGLKAIELQFNNRKSIIRIGTNIPNEISSVIQKLINNEIPLQTDNLGNKKRIRPMWIILIITLLISIILIVSGNQETKVNIDSNGFTIKGFYGQTIPYSELIQVDTVSILPKIELRINGYSLGKTKNGNFRLADKSYVKLFIKKGFAPYILIQSKNREPIYINFEDKQKTLNLYNELIMKK